MQKGKAFKLVFAKVLALPASTFLLLISMYKVFISPLKPQTCRFYPSCSSYVYEAVKQYGLIKGCIMGTGRLLRCHPFNPGGYDPVN